ncbi:MAG TPA: putative Ig domain-containing protein [Geothrix sp.]|nr:putative Ig domain-containing protein [Geothrix sp.]
MPGLTRIHLGTAVWLILVLCFSFVVGIAVVLKRGMKSSMGFFLSGRAIPAWIVGLAFLSANLGAQEVINLEKPWKFIPGDNAAYLQPGFDDSPWVSLKVDRVWEEQGYEKLDGYGWYRIRFVLPEKMRQQDSLRAGVRFDLGKVNNFDQSYLNGRLLGCNTKVAATNEKPDPDYIKAPSTLLNETRVYVIPVDDPRLRWGAENVLAIRVYDEGGLGGMFNGGQNVRMIRLSDSVGMDPQSSAFDSSARGLRKTLRVTNTSHDRRLKGRFTVKARGLLSGAAVIRRSFALELAPGAYMDVPVVLGVREESCLMTYAYDLGGGDRAVRQETSPYILTPAAPASPRINGPAILGARPGRDFIFTVPVSGERPIRVAARGLPAGLRLDAATGIARGTTPAPGTYKVTFTATNAKGSAQRELEFAIGDRLALTPPMGWNSWNVWGLAVDEEKVVASARTFVAKGLRDHGWGYVNIDDGWEIKGSSPEPKRLPDGGIRVNEKFPNMTRLGDRLHELGLRFGIYSSPGPLTCGQYTASYQHEAQDAHAFASWGVDYLKYDWCSYDQVAKDQSRAELMKPYEVMREALAKTDRDIVYSLCQYGVGRVWEWGDQVGGQLWRTTEDIEDTWKSMSGIGFSQAESSPFARPGNWNDPDMLVVGWVGWGPSLHRSRLTADEQYTHLSLWSLLSAPLLIGCDLTRLDAFTLNLLTNDEVLAVDQDRLGRQATPALKDGDIQVWAKEMADGSRTFGVFNLGSAPANYTVDLTRLGLRGRQKLRDLWRQKELGSASGRVPVRVAPHGVVLLKAREAD